MHIGLGCAVENMMLAAAARGHEAKLTLVDGTLELIPAAPRPILVATVELAPGPARQDELYDAIPRRHTNRAPYDRGRAIAPELLRSLQLLPGESPSLKLLLFGAESERKKLGDLMVAATETIIADKSMVDDSQRWFRQRWAGVQKLRDGPTLDTAGLSPWVTALAKIAPAPSPERNHRYWLAAPPGAPVPSAAL